MNIIALLSWYDEDPVWLERMILSLDGIVDRVVALDGAYALFDGGRGFSSFAEHQAIKDAAEDIGANWSISTPQSVFSGNEVAKRNELFRIGDRYAEDGDWFMVVDADYEVTEAPQDVHERLAATSFDVGAVTLLEPGHALGPIVFDTFPMFFRAIPGITCYRNHFTYRTPDGRNLWGDARRDRVEPREDLSAVKVTHWSQLRPHERRDRAIRYYERRDREGVEEIPEVRYAVAL